MATEKIAVKWQPQVRGRGNNVPASHLAKFALGQRPSSALDRFLAEEL